MGGEWCTEGDGLVRDPKGNAAPTALGRGRGLDPALAGWARLYRAYGAGLVAGGWGKVKGSWLGRRLARS